LKTVARELAKYKSDLVGVHEVRWALWVALNQQTITYFSMEVIMLRDTSLTGNHIGN
jgi:hypothetical protein